MAEEPATRIIRLEEEVEGDQEGSSDFVFRRIGESVPLLPFPSPFDLSNPPYKPLAVSDRYGALFLAHSEGFLIVKTKDVIDLAKEIKDKGKGPCVQDSSALDVRIGTVSLLSLSCDSSMLAVETGGEIHFFSVSSLLNKEQKPIFSCSLSGSSSVKDFKWQENGGKSYVILSNNGLLYHGNLMENPNEVLDNIDAVDCSSDGKFIAVARKNEIRILSINFEVQLCLSLSFESWSTDTDSDSTFKVDSIGWVRDDSIVVGSVILNEEGNEEGYPVHVITSGESNFFESSCQPVVYSFPYLFGGISDDILPPGFGPNLLLSYLDHWELLLASNKKNIDEHVVLLKYGDNKDLVSLEFKNDKYTPRVELQENEDDNTVLGFGIEKVSLFEKIAVQVGTEIEELAPQYILLCLTCEGKLIMYHVASTLGPAELPQPIVWYDESESSKENQSATVLSQAKLTVPTIESPVKSTGEETTVKFIQAKPTVPSTELPIKITGVEPTVKFVQAKPTVPSFESPVKITGEESAVKFTPSKPTVPPIESSIKSAETTVKFTQAKTMVPSNESPCKSTGAEPTVKIIQPKPVPTIESPIKITGSISMTPSETSIARISGDLSKGFSAWPQPVSNPFGPASLSLNKSTEKLETGFGNNKLSFSLPGNFSSETKSLSAVTPSKVTQVESERNLSKEFYTVKDMIKELDALLYCIEKDGGLRDSCILSHQNSLLKLEEALQNLSELSRIYKNKAQEQLMMIQDLKNKMSQVSARQIYVEGIVSQSSDSHYRDMWDRQKLTPEFELKRQNILKANQNLTSQLVELERHFNNLEINRFGEVGRNLYSNAGRSRQTVSLHSVYNTLNSQLAAAEQLSQCLSKQISMLNISSPSPSSKRGSVKKELFESIGLSYASPDFTKSGLGSNSSGRVSSFKRDHPKRISVGGWNGFEPETARRRRESLDTSWAGLEPQKTTVKRISHEQKQQQQFRVGSDKKFKSNKEILKLEMESIMRQKSSNDRPLSSLAQSSLAKFNPLIQEIQERIPQKTVSPPQQSSIFKWARDFSSSYQNSDSKSHELHDTATSSGTGPPMPTVPYQSPFGGTQITVKENYTLPVIKSAQTVPPSLPKSNSNAQLSSTVSPMKNTATESGGQFGKFTINLRTGEDAPKPSVFANSNSQLSSTVSTMKSTAIESGGQFGKFTLNLRTGEDAPKPSGFALPGLVRESNTTSVSLSSVSTQPADASAKVQSTVLKPVPSLFQSSSQSTSPATTSFLRSNSGTETPKKMNQTTNSIPSVSISPPQKPTPSVSPPPEISKATPTQPAASEVSVAPTPVTGPTSVPVSIPTSISSVPTIISKLDEEENEDEMEEETPDTNTTPNLNFGALGGFGLGLGLGSTPPTTNQPKANPFGSGSFATSSNTSNFNSTPVPALTPTPGSLFRPASLSFPSSPPQAQPAQSLSTSTGAFSNNLGGLSGFGQPAQIGSGFGQPAQIGSGFGQPAQIGSGQQALGSVLGSFGQSRQMGLGSAAPSGLGFGGGGFSSVSGGGFGGFAGAPSSGGGFSGGGFAGAAAGGGGFAALATKSGGFAGAAAAGGSGGGAGQAGGGFMGGGFGAFSSNSTGQGRPPSELLTQMRK